MKLLEKLKSLECSLHGTRRSDRAWLEHILHPDFKEITRSGVVIERAETIESLTSELNVTVILSCDFEIFRQSERFALLYYRTFNPDGGRIALRSSCWECNDDGEWKLVFHQATPASGTV
ncbi:nuclear transport factor 2 family protein [Enterobacter cloacae]|uniref:nuclear transport factor 2 family protein n=1 Tax=Enterobacter cloacae TaxID=550 RepID=UPI001E2D4C6C|nr:nuclear transport factor 2 family protein [Enterobacter cloacae]ELK7331409.1 nuclear transport factor 2 family protein [Enterobacter cloacae]MCE1970272.1 nuclear transport factor 2 family protein [Enterobacter cloacae]MCU6218386.1 nuclear transport factor 2 family protein [Enterobacter cloacae]HCM9192244.1 nuclear transport factor 2 family protein [Enterobacter cloacae subsp. dissolvens]